MKRVTKMSVLEILKELVGWNFTYTFKESQRLYLFNSASSDAIKERLEANGIEVVDYTPPQYPRTGSMTLRMKPE